MMPSQPPYKSLPVAWPLAVLTLAAVCGCGGGLDDRRDISGEVTLDGAPLASGAISLRPLRKGQSTGATIHEGKFAIAGERAPKFGKYRVEIDAYLPTGKKVSDPDNPGALTDEIKQILPDRYNRRSELEIEITPESDHPLTFDLKSK